MSIHIKNHIFCGKSWSTPKNSPVPIRSQGPRVPSATSPPVIPWHCPAAPEAAPLCGAPAHSSRAEWATDSGGRWWCLGQKSSEFPMFVDGWWYSHPSEKYESQLGWLFPIYGKIKNVPNHQSVVHCFRWRAGKWTILSPSLSGIFQPAMFDDNQRVSLTFLEVTVGEKHRKSANDFLFLGNSRILIWYSTISEAIFWGYIAL